MSLIQPESWPLPTCPGARHTPCSAGYNLAYAYVSITHSGDRDGGTNETGKSLNATQVLRKCPKLVSACGSTTYGGYRRKPKLRGAGVKWRAIGVFGSAKRVSFGHRT